MLLSHSQTFDKNEAGKSALLVNPDYVSVEKLDQAIIESKLYELIMTIYRFQIQEVRSNGSHERQEDEADIRHILGD